MRLRRPDKQVVRATRAYGGKSVLQHLPEGVDLISRVASNAALYEPAPPRRDKQRGAPRKKGARLPAMADWAANPTQPWEALEFDQYGLHATLQVKTIRGLYYRAGKDRLLVIVLVRDVAGGRPDQRFSGTRTDWDARTILSHYAGRWSIELQARVHVPVHRGFIGPDSPASRPRRSASPGSRDPPTG